MAPKRSAENDQSGPQKKQKTTTATATAALKATSTSIDSSLHSTVIRDKAIKIRASVYRLIKGQMTFMPACRTGTSKWSCTQRVPNVTVFVRLFRVEPTAANGKKWKQKKIPIDQFERCFGEISTPSRYGTLCVMDPYIILKWNEANNEFTISGKYGLSELRKYTDKEEE